LSYRVAIFFLGRSGVFQKLQARKFFAAVRAQHAGRQNAQFIGFLPTAPVQEATLQISNLARFAETALQAFEFCDDRAFASLQKALR
jgi:hypothetical protein